MRGSMRAEAIKRRIGPQRIARGEGTNPIMRIIIMTCMLNWYRLANPMVRKSEGGRPQVRIETTTQMPRIILLNTLLTLWRHFAKFRDR